MRLTKTEAAKAKVELVHILAQYPAGLRTSQLQGTPKLHGVRTLSLRQIARLLRDTPNVEHSYDGSSYMAASWWKLKPNAQARNS